MRVIRGLHNIRSQDQGGVLTFGNFDGVHCGHQALIKTLKGIAPQQRSTVVCFEPQPMEFLRPNEAPVRLQRLSEKLRFLAKCELDQVLVLPFNRALAQMPAEQFVSKVLIGGMQATAVVVGDDWRFGYQRRGDVALLRRMGQHSGFAVHQLDTLMVQEGRVSSTRVRGALDEGDLSLVSHCLGRRFRIRGRVVHGQKLGRKLGAPTANIGLAFASPLRHGVYCVRLNGQPAVANIGVRPTLNESIGEHLEVHLLQGNHELYGKMVVVEFERFIRPEQAFADLTELKAAIAQDVAVAKQYFEQEPV
ncbi:MAG: bifunctional riboflavin kinase/FAD synthetase [Oceanococcus sp.]